MKIAMLGLILALFTPVAFSRALPRQTKPAKKAATVAPDAVFPISGKMELEGRVIRGSIRKSEIDSLLARRVYLGGNSDDQYGKYGLGVVYDEGRLPVFSCQEWAQARRLGLDGNFNTYERSMQSFF